MSRLVRVLCDACPRECPDDFVHLEVPRFDADPVLAPIDLCATCAGLALEELLAKLATGPSYEHDGEMIASRQVYRDFYARWHPRPNPSL